jgi:rSAM/selenodomain-associated transferase 1
MTNPSSDGTGARASCGIAVMAKASAAGRTKTRLVPPLSFEEAAAFNTAFLRDVAGNILAAGRVTPTVAYMAYAPPGAEAFFRDILPEVGLIEAWFPQFGDCLDGTIAALFARGHASAVVLNADGPTLPTSLLVETAAELAKPGDRAVLGPTADGGYYLLGLKQRHRRLFEDIAWSTEQVARQTLERAHEIALAVHVLPVWYDVDAAGDLRMLHGELCQGGSFSPRLDPYPAPHTARLMRALVAETDFAARLGCAGAVDAPRAAE